MNCGLARVRTTAEPTAQADDLPPTQYLVMEVLAARHRTGEPYWTFPSSLRNTLDALVRAGLIDALDSPVALSLRARLTEAGRKHSLKPDYVPPNGGIDRLRRALEFIAEYAEERADLVIGMQSVASTARQALTEPMGAPR
jgi:hypothetical protein